MWWKLNKEPVVLVEASNGFGRSHGLYVFLYIFSHDMGLDTMKKLEINDILSVICLIMLSMQKKKEKVTLWGLIGSKW